MVELTSVQLAHDVERLQAELAAVQAERKLLVESLAYHERDRPRMAYEIHDGIIQEMTAALMFLEAAGAQAAFAGDDAREQHQRGLRMLRDAVNEARRLLRGLIPVELDERGLTASVARLVEKFRADQALEIDYRANLQFDRLTPAVEMMVLRIVQEALNNVWKHSQSNRAEVRLVQRGDDLEVTIRDWGVGFDPQAASKLRYGLTGIRERARLLGGIATIDGGPGHGTRVSVRFRLGDALLPPAAGGSGDPRRAAPLRNL
jgi:signal transduction histidine kinase